MGNDTLPLHPIDGFTYLAEAPFNLDIKHSMTFIVVNSTSEDVKPGMTVVADLVNEDYRMIKVNGVQLFVVPNRSILLVLE